VITLFEAVISGRPFVSCVSGRLFTPQMLAPVNRIGEFAVSYRSCGMTEAERKGKFEIYVGERIG
jgi:hypothetical protein